MTWETLVDPQIVNAIGWALLHFVWQGALAVVVLGAADGLLGRGSARVRYALATATLTVMAVLPVVTFVNGLDGAGQPATPGPFALAPTGTRVSDAVAPVAAGAASAALDERLDAALPVLVGLWGLGVALLSVRVLGGFALAQRIARSGHPTTSAGLAEAMARLCRAMRISRPVRLLESVRVEVPTVVGWLRPVILFPAATLAGLTPAQLEVVLAHELAHVRRLDYLVNLLQTAVETLLFYHPAVWWVSYRVRVEREHCCDDAAVAACGDALAYARALTDLEGLRLTGAGLAMAADGGSLVHRVGRLVGKPPSQATGGSRALGALLALVVLPAFLAGSGWLDAHAQSAASPTSDAASPAAEDEAVAEIEEATEPAQAAPAPAARERDAVASKDTPLPLGEVIELAQAGVTPEYLDEMAAAGYANLSWRQLIELRSQGVSPDYIRGLAAEGHKGLSTERLVELRSKGVSPDFVKGLREQGLDRLSLDALLELRSQGVTPEYVEELKAEGYADLSPGALVNLRNQGVTPDYVRDLKTLGYGGLSTTKLVALRNQGVTADYVRGLKDLGYADLSIPTLIGLRNQGVTPDYVRELRELGYQGLATGLLIELRSQGVTPDFVREVKDAGWDNVTAEELIELRSQGIRGDLLRRLRRDQRPPAR
jgi:beta-lactamase regulating signal transducer with metallopeptidase domain